MSSPDERILPNVRFRELTVPRGIMINWTEKIEGTPECGFSELDISLKASNWYDSPIRSGFDSMKLNLFFQGMFSIFIRIALVSWIICFCGFIYSFCCGNYGELSSKIVNVFSFQFLSSGFSLDTIILCCFIFNIICLFTAIISKLIVFIDNLCYNLNSEIKLQVVPESLTIETFGFYKIKEVFKAENIKRIYYNQFFDIRMIISTESGDRDYVLIYNLPSEYIARFFEQEFERTLGIIDSAIEGEYDFEKKNLYIKYEKEEAERNKTANNTEEEKQETADNNEYRHPYKSIVNFSKYFSFNKDENELLITKYSSPDEAFRNLSMLFIWANFSLFMALTTGYYFLLACNTKFESMWTFLLILYLGFLAVFATLGFFYCKYRFSNYAISFNKTSFIIWKIDFLGKKSLEYTNDIKNITDFRSYECDFSLSRILQNPENILSNIMKSIRNKKYGYGIIVYMKDNESKFLIKNIGSSKNAEYLADMLYETYCSPEQ